MSKNILSKSLMCLSFVLSAQVHGLKSGEDTSFEERWRAYQSNPANHRGIIKELADEGFIPALIADHQMQIKILNESYSQSERTLALLQSQIDQHGEVDLNKMASARSSLNDCSEALAEHEHDLENLKELRRKGERFAPVLSWDDLIDDDQPYVFAPRSSVRQELAKNAAHLKRIRGWWLTSIKEVGDLTASVGLTQALKERVLRAMKSERNRMNKVDEFLKGSRPSNEKLERCLDDQILERGVDISGVLGAMVPTLDECASGHLNEVQVLRDQIYNLVGWYDSASEPGLYQGWMAREFGGFQLSSKIGQVDGMTSFLVRLGSMMQATHYATQHASLVCWDDLQYDCQLINDMQRRCNTYQLWFVNQQSPQLNYLFLGGGMPQEVVDFMREGFQIWHDLNGYTQAEVEHFLVQQTCFSCFNWQNNFFENQGGAQKIWVYNSKPWSIRIHPSAQSGETIWTFGLLKEHPYKQAGRRRHQDDIRALLVDQNNEVMKFDSNGAVSFVSPARQRKPEDEHAWRHMELAPRVMNWNHFLFGH